ncbi:MAG: sigma 54-interacting transcriptional regulator [Candidatus Eisenbacteria bacterium]|uniref:Sigma 54-interacting transcriptional regulator n=1 Tax=Eiseniibacteriota bacterium TaxID=2212470 RepID=A0A937X845_UNCEI|nr:sigma 54-interacting transcriptional regulator [Candidatus Eisenbacteria bacterium]
MPSENPNLSGRHDVWIATSQDVRSIIAQARIYLCAGAWQSAHELLAPAVVATTAATDANPETLEALGLLLVACSRLGHIEHLAQGTAVLREALALGVPLDPESRALATLHALRQMIDRGNYAAAASVAATLCEPWIDKVSCWTRSRVELVAAWLSARLGDLEAAERSALHGALLAEESRSDSLLADALVAVANVRSLQRDLIGAQRILAQAVEYYWRVGDGIGRTTALVNRGLALLFEGDVVGSAAAFTESEASALSLGRQDSLLRSRLGLGWLAARGGRTEQARRLLLPAWRAARRAGLKREEVLALEYLSEAYLWASDPRRFLPRTRAALGLCRQQADFLDPEGDISLECRIREAMLAHVEEHPSQAERVALEAVEHARRQRFPWEEAEAWRVVGVARVAMGCLDGAFEAFGQSLDLFLGLGEHFERWYVEAWLHVLDGMRVAPRSNSTADAEAHSPRQPQGGSSNVGEVQHTEDLKHWLRHAQVGPLAWNSSRAGLSEASRKPTVQATAPPEIAPDTPPPPSPTWSALGLVTRSSTLRDTLLLSETYAAESIPILILGETGTGKDLLARGLHDLSGRGGRLVPVNCAAAQRQLFAAELFGARRGAYTGAVDHRRGLIHEASEGTIFFDEIADLDPEAQGYLLRFLDSGEVRPLGDTRGERVETRVLAATRRDLHALVASGSFREDLYMRLAAVILVLPPLRDRLVDLPLLIEALWLRAGGAPEDRETVFTPEVLRELRQRPWPGNVRELSHVVSRSIPLLRARGAAAARARIQNRAGLGWHDGSHGQGQARSHPASSGDAGSAAARMDSGGGSGRDPALAPTDVTPPGRASAISPSPHRILAKDPEGNWPESLLRNALDVAKGHVPTAARILGISRSQAYRLYKQLRGSRG